MNLGLRNKNAIITGGSHGIGLAIAKLLAAEGCNIFLLARDTKRLRAAGDEILASGVDCHIYSVDVLSEEQLDNCLAEISSTWNEIHILINNVGGGGRWGSENIAETSSQVWEEVFDKNYTAALTFTRFVIPYMQRQNWGRVVTITSILGREAGGRPWFNVAKTAQTTLMKNLSLNKDLVRKNITFNSVAPGCIMIPDTGWAKERDSDPEGFARRLDSDFPLGRLGSVDEVAYATVMLCGEQASLINGAALAVDGGESVSF